MWTQAFAYTCYSIVSFQLIVFALFEFGLFVDEIDNLFSFLLNGIPCTSLFLVIMII